MALCRDSADLHFAHAHLLRMALLLCLRHSATGALYSEYAPSSNTSPLGLQKRPAASFWKAAWAMRLCSFTAPLYSDLRSPPSTGYSINARQWNRLLHVLGENAALCRQIPGLWLPKSGKVIRVAGSPVTRKSGIPPVPPSGKPAWVDVADPAATEVSLQKASKECLVWLATIFQATPSKPLKLQPQLQCLSTADAMGEGHLEHRRLDGHQTGPLLVQRTMDHWRSQSHVAVLQKRAATLHGVLGNDCPVGPPATGPPIQWSPVPNLLYALWQRQHCRKCRM